MGAVPSLNASDHLRRPSHAKGEFPPPLLDAMVLVVVVINGVYRISRSDFRFPAFSQPQKKAPETMMLFRTAQPLLQRRGIRVVVPAAQHRTETKPMLGKSINWARNYRHLTITSPVRTKSKRISSCHHSRIISLGTTTLLNNVGRPPLFHAIQYGAAIRIYSSQQGGPNNNTPRSRLVSSLGMIGAGGMLLLGKGKYLIGALKLTKFASLGSMLLTVGAYTAFCESNNKLFPFPFHL